MKKTNIYIILSISILFLFLFFISIFSIFSFFKQKQNFFVTIPHHNLINSEIDKFYADLSKKYDVDNIVIISPNHFYKKGDSFFESNLDKGKYCFGDENNIDKQKCLKLEKFENPIFTGTTSQIFTYDTDKKTYFFTEHGIGNHFSFINKYFKNTKVYPVILKINRNYDENTKNIFQKLKNHHFSGNTLFIASVDFSHHVNEKVAKFHDKKAIDVLNNKLNSQVEVDCPNCLYAIKDLARNENKADFSVFKRTSSSEFIGKNTNYDNTSYVMGEFQTTNPEIKKDKFAYGMFFGDLHFTRGFTYSDNKISQEKYFECFYQNKDVQKKPEFWHNRMFYGFDIVGVNLETSVAKIDECQKSNKSIVFRTEPEKLDLLKKIGINTFSLANNHSYDCGNSGYQATKKYLQERELIYFGDGRKDESVIYAQTINGIKIALVGLNDVDLIWKIEDKLEKIKKLKADGYAIILNIHWGDEYKTIANEKQTKQARQFADAGVNLIIGHHPHVVQNYEIYKGVPIFYSLGNFIFDQPFLETLPGYGIVFAINEQKVDFDLIEFKRNPKTYKIDCESFK